MKWFSVICELIFAFTSSFISLADRCSQRLFSAVVDSRMCLNAHNVTVFLSSLRRSDSIVVSHTDLIALVWLSSVGVKLHRLNLHKCLRIMIFMRMVPDVYVYYVTVVYE